MSISISNRARLMERLPCFISERTEGVVLQSNGQKGWGMGMYDFLAGCEPMAVSPASFAQLNSWHQAHGDWALGYIAYDAKNELERLSSRHTSDIEVWNIRFFVPRYMFLVRNNQLELGYRPGWDSEESAAAYVQIILEHPQPDCAWLEEVQFQARVSKERYVQQVGRVQQAIQRGDLYEMNYSMEYYGHDASFDPARAYLHLQRVSPTPFSAFVKLHGVCVMSASPERYLYKKGRQLVSQPIKGTAPRHSQREQDLMSRNMLMESEKERAENVMIVDLVRNDLARVASRGSVDVTELCGVYPFQQVYQMVSTIRAQLKPGLTFADALAATFPMGSMTGAPKISSMNHIDALEEHRRGLYSGSVGYIDPQGDFDMNVVIRSLVYNLSSGYLSYMVGGAITNLSDPEQEYQECQWKALAIRKALQFRDEGAV